ncbi:MAG: hypothetical protein NC548_18780 [Lachnospiraceae bacterium]|nr:hypothetical protein [Lachnospiraceae bacterium]
MCIHGLLLLLKGESLSREEQGDGDRQPDHGIGKRFADEYGACEKGRAADYGARLAKCCSHGWGG